MPDALGNQTAESTYDPSGALHRTHTRVFNTLSQLYQDVDAAHTAAVTTTYAYDSNGNRKSAAAPLSRTTGELYDALNRLKQITDPGNGVTALAYDTNDNLISVTHPRSLVTSYTYDGFGDLLTQVSPDTGTSTDTYDSGGNLAQLAMLEGGAIFLLSMGIRSVFGGALGHLPPILDEG